MLALVLGGDPACAAVTAALAPHGFAVVRAVGALPVPAPGGERVRLVVLDWDALPDGAAACRALAADPLFDDATLLALSADRTPARLLALFAAGASDVLALPDDAARLVARALHAAREGAADSLEAHGHLYRRVFEHNPLPMALVDDETLRFLDVSDGALSQYGWSREEFRARTLRDIRPPSEVGALEEALGRSDPSFLTTTHRRKDGSEFVSRGVFQRITVGGRSVRFAVTRDVTEEVRAAAAQRRSLDDYKELVERSADGVFTHRPFPNDLVAYANPAFVAFLGYHAAAEIVGRPVLDFVHPDDRDLVRSRIHGIVTTAQASQPRPIRFIGADGAERWAETRGISVSYEGAPAVTVIARDLGERRRAQEQLRLSEERFSRVFQGSPAAIAIVRLSDGMFVDVNERFVATTGYTRQEVIGRTGLEVGIWHDLRDRAAVYEAIRAQGGSRDVEVQIVIKSGAVRDMLLSTVPIDVGGEPCKIGLAVDITERKRLEEHLRHAHKMEAVGRLAGGIAHDFNNLLTGIRGYSEVLVGQLPAGSSMRQAAEHIQRSALRGASLTSQLLVFTRRQPVQPTVLVLDEEVRNLGALLRRIIGADVVLELGLGAVGARVRADAAQLEQVILNLAVNARDAMPAGGRLTIATALGVDASGRPAVRLTVGDTGVGMSAEVRTRIFEPFFTTKEVGRGTGLGLSIVYGIIEQSGGTIVVQSAPGQGTRFDISLPRVDEPLPPPPPPPPGMAPKGTETILVVEDDDDVRDFVRLVLELGGYHVLVAEDGARALELARSSSDPIDLLLSDLLMPNLNGRQLAARLVQVRPSVKVMHMSGYPGIASERAEGRSDTTFLQKPFSADELLRAVRAAIDRPGG